MDAKLERLAAVPFFAKCDRKELERVATAVDAVEVAAGTVLIRQGGFSHEAYVIESGVAEVDVDGEVVAEIPEGQMVGEVGLLTRAAASATVRAKTALSVLVLPHNRFIQVLEDSPTMGTAIARALAERLQAMDERLH